MSVKEWLIRRGWIVLLLLAPIYAFVTPALTPALLAVPALLAILWVAAPATPHRLPLDWPILLLAIMVLVSLWVTFSIAFSLPKIAGLVLGVGLYYSMLSPGRRSPRALAKMTALFLAAGGAIALFGLLGTAWATKLPVLNALVARLPSVIVSLPGAESGLQPNEVAGVLLWIAPVALALTAAVGPNASALVRQYGAARIWAAAGLLALSALTMIGVIVLTQSRSGLFGLAVAVLVMLFWAGRLGRWISLCLLVVVAVVALWAYGQQLNALFVYAVTGTAATPGPAHFLLSFEQRLEIWSRAVYGIQDFAFTGMGMNTFRKLAGVLYPLTMFGPETDLYHAHNMWLQAALDLGLPGLVAYVALWLNVGVMLVQTLRAVRHPGLQALAVGLAGAVAGSLAFGLPDAVALGARPGFLWWWLLALITLAWMHRTAPRVWEREGEAPPTRSDPAAPLPVSAE